MRAIWALGLGLLLAGPALAQEALYDQRLDPQMVVGLPDVTLGRLRVMQPGELERIVTLPQGLNEAERLLVDQAVGTAFSTRPADERVQALRQLQAISTQIGGDFPALEWQMRQDALGTARPDSLVMADVIKAAENGLAEGENPLSLGVAGRGLLCGEAVRPDFYRSHIFIEKLQELAPSRENGDLLARQYLYGWGTKADLGAAEAIWKPQAEAGDVQAMIDYADLLARRGGAEDLAARRTFLEEAQQADAAKYRLFQDAVTRRDAAEVARWRGELEGLAGAELPAAALLGDYYFDAGQPRDAQLVLQSWANAGEGLAAAKLGRLLLRDGEELGYSRQDALDYLTIGLVEQQSEALLGLAEYAIGDEQPELAYAAASAAEATGDARVAAQARALVFATCTSLKERCAPVPVLYVTNRAPIYEDGRLNGFGNGPDPEGRVSYGVSTVKVYLSGEQRRKRQDLLEGGLGWIGALANCTNPFGPALTCQMLRETDPAKVRPVTEARDERGADFFSFAKSLDLHEAGGARDVFLYVHGFATDFDGAVRQAASAAESAGFPGVPVLMSWVANDGPFPDVTTRYMSDFAQAQAFCPVLRKAVIEAGTVFGFDHVKLMAHSMGNVATLAALTGCAPQSFAGGSVEMAWPEPSAIGNLVLAAPDVGVPDVQSAADMALFDLLDRRSEHLTVYQSTNDWALNTSASGLFNGKRRIGQGGEPRTLLPGAHMIDATGVEQSGQSNHFYVFDVPQVVTDLGQALGGIFDRTQRKCLRDEAYNGQAGAYSAVLGVCQP